MSKFRLFIFVFVGLMFLACFPSRKLAPPKEITPEFVLEKASGYERNLLTFAGRVNVQFKNKQKFSTDLEIFYKAPDTFALYFESYFGINIFAMVLRNDSVLYCIPRESKYYYDSYQNFLKSKEWSWEVNLVELLDFIIFKNGLPNENIVFSGSDKRDFVFRLENEDGQKDFWLEQKKFLLKKVEWKRKDNDETFFIDYQRYKTFGDVLYPKEIEVKSSLAKRILRLKFKEVKVNTVLPEKKFDLKIPENARRIP
jgi:outer membrane lipoprotein-sorting protein